MEPSVVNLKVTDQYTLGNTYFDLGDNKEINARNQFSFRVNRIDYKAIFGDDLWVVDSKLYNSLNIFLNRTNWKLTESVSGLEEIQYNILPFNDENRGSFEFEFNDNPRVLVNIPVTIKKDNPKIYTFIVEVTYLEITRKSRLTIEILQWVDYWQLWANSTHCAKCIYEKIDEYTQECMNIFIGNLYYIDFILWWFFMFAFIFWLFKFIPHHIYINALNYYQSVLLVLTISYLKHNSLKFAVTIFSSLCPYFTSFVFLRLITINYDPVFSQDSKLLIDFIRNERIEEILSQSLGILLVLFAFLIISILWIIWGRKYEAIIKLKYKFIVSHSLLWYTLFSTLLMVIVAFIIYQFFFDQDIRSHSFFIIIIWTSIVIMISITLNIFDSIYVIKNYTNKIFFNVVNTTDITDCYFEGLKNEPMSLLFNILNNFKKFSWSPIIFLFILWYILKDSRDRESYIFYLWLICSIFVIEASWFIYLIKVYPYKSLSANRILIIHQISILTFWIWGIINYTDGIYYGIFDDYLLVIIEYIRAIFILPLGYLFFFIHALIIKICYKKKAGIIYPKFWRIKNPNLHYASENSFTEYMAIDPYRKVYE